MSSKTESVAVIAAGIQLYCADHPNAADTIDGIRGWWLAEPLRESSIHDVQHALDHLVAQGIVARRTLPNGTAIYFSSSRPAGEEPND